MLESLTVIVLFEVAGDSLQSLMRVPIPGPVIGMALLLAALIGKGRLPDGLDSARDCRHRADNALRRADAAGSAREGADPRR